MVSVTLSPHNGMPGMVHSGAARAAVENMMRTLSVEWARFGIKLNALAAGQFGTDTLLTKYPKQIVDGVAASVPLQRMGEPAELAWLVAFLASPAGDFTTGTVLTVDGARDNWIGRLAAAGDRRGHRLRGGGGAQAEVTVGRVTPADYATILDEHEQFWGERDLRPAHHPGAGARVRRHVRGRCTTATSSWATCSGSWRVAWATCTWSGCARGTAARAWPPGCGRSSSGSPVAVGRTTLRAITTPANEMSIGFHRSLGMAVERVADYAGPGHDRIVFTRALEGAPAELDHVLVAVPVGATEAVRAFYGDALGLPELDVPRVARPHRRLVRPGRPPAARARVRGLHARAARPPGAAPRPERAGGGGRAAGGRGCRGALGRPAGRPAALLHPRPVGEPGRGAGLPMTLAAVVVSVLVGAVLQSATGFGFALVTAPVLFAVFTPGEALTLLALMAGTLSALVLFSEGRDVDVHADVGPLVAWGVPGMAIGVLLLRAVDKPVLQVGVGAGGRDGRAARGAPGRLAGDAEPGRGRSRPSA